MSSTDKMTLQVTTTETNSSPDKGSTSEPAVALGRASSLARENLSSSSDPCGSHLLSMETNSSATGSAQSVPGSQSTPYSCLSQLATPNTTFRSPLGATLATPLITTSLSLAPPPHCSQSLSSTTPSLSSKVSSSTSNENPPPPYHYKYTPGATLKMLPLPAPLKHMRRWPGDCTRKYYSPRRELKSHWSRWEEPNPPCWVTPPMIPLCTLHLQEKGQR